MRKRVVLLASGDGSLAQAIMDAKNRNDLDIEISEVVSDQPEANVLTRAKLAGIATFSHPMSKDRGAWNTELRDHVSQLNPDLVVSVGFMRILSPTFVSRFKIINTHPSMLPLFPGAHAVRDALAAGSTKTGATVHWVDEGVDTGKLITQVEIPILPEDDEESLHERIKIVERELIVDVIRKLIPHLESAHA
jgi:phosphoribosylglycinamide formyltransferase-1